MYSHRELINKAVENLTFLTAPVNVSNKTLFQAWERLPAQNRIYLQNFPPVDIPDAHDHLVIWHPLGNWSDARVGEIGRIVAQRFGRDAQGRLLSKLFTPTEAPKHLRLLRQAVQTQQALFVGSTLHVDETHILSLELTLLPVQAPDGHGNLVLVCVSMGTPRKA